MHKHIYIRIQLIVLQLLFTIFFTNYVFSQETADVRCSFRDNNTDEGFPFRWTWSYGINCGDTSQDGINSGTRSDTFIESKSGNSQITFNSTEEQRFSDLPSAKFYTDASIYATCNQNFSVERAETNIKEGYQSAGGTIGNTVWLGWSQLYTNFDYNHASTHLQFRNQCSYGSPRTGISFRPANTAFNGKLSGLCITAGMEYTSGVGTAYTSGGSTHKNLITADQLETNVWYDFVVEVKLSKENTGYVRVWVAPTTGTDGPVQLDYDHPTAEILDCITAYDDCPHIRWGVYRWDSSDHIPEEIPYSDQILSKFHAQARFKFGNDLGEDGFNAVVPRSPLNPDVYSDTTYLSDLDVFAFEGVEPVMDQDAYGNSINIGDNEYTKGISVFTPAQVSYLLHKNYKRLQADLGLDESADASGELIYRFYGDGHLIETTPVITSSDSAYFIDLNLEGLDSLRIEIESNLSGNSDHAVLANAYLLHTMVQDFEIEALGNIGDFYVDSSLLVQAHANPLTATNDSVQWQLVNLDGQASITPGGWLTGIAPGWIRVRAFALDGSGVKDSLDIQVNRLVDSIQIQTNGQLDMLYMDSTLQLSALVFPDNASHDSLVWSVDYPSIASIDQNGLLTGLQEGLVTISAKATDGSRVSTSKKVEVIARFPYSSTIWKNYDMGEQEGQILVEFTATPSRAYINSYTGLSKDSAGSFNDLACVIYFMPDGRIQVRNGSLYTAETDWFYSGEIAYHFELSIDINANSYNVWVSAKGEAKELIAEDFAFRTSAEMFSSLQYWNLYAVSGSHYVQDFSVTNLTSNPVLSQVYGRENSIAMKVYPNPVTGSQATIELSLPSGKDFSLELVDILYHQIYQMDIPLLSSPETIQIPFDSEFPPGLYFMILKQNGIRKLVQKVVLKE